MSKFVPLLNDKQRAALRAVLDAIFPAAVGLHFFQPAPGTEEIAVVTGLLSQTYNFLFLVWPSKEQVEAERAARVLARARREVTGD